MFEGPVRRCRVCFDGRVRVLFSTTAGEGHFGPMVPVARACAAAGHEVAVAAPGSFAANVGRVGLRHLPVPDPDPDQVRAVFGGLAALSHDEANRVVVSEVFGRLDAQAALPGLIDILSRWQPDVVVRDPAELGSMVAAERFGVSQVQVAIGVGPFLGTVTGWFDEPVRELELLAGLDPVPGAGRALATPTLTSVPAVLETASGGTDSHPGRVWRFRADARPPGSRLPGSWGDPAAPLVYATFGSVAGSQPHLTGLYADLLEVLAALPVRVLMTTGTGLDPARLQPVPGNAWVTAWWPQSDVMGAAALAIGHGGFGTTMTAAAAGVPQIVMPLFASDQFVNAQCIQAVGAGLQLLGGPDDLGQVPAAVHALLGGARYAQRARAVADEIAALPDVSTTVGVLETLAS